jgi:cell wall-associated NlpC family hydrolase
VASARTDLIGARRRLGVSILAAVLLAGAVAVGSPGEARAAVAPTSEAGKVISLTKDQLGKPYVFGTTGMQTYDCSGLVYRMFKKLGLVDRIGSKRRGASGYWRWFRRRGLASKSNPRPGDLMVWLDGGHIGFYINSTTAIDATPSRGVGYRKIGSGTWSAKHFNAYLHVKMTR